MVYNTEGRMRSEGLNILHDGITSLGSKGSDMIVRDDNRSYLDKGSSIMSDDNSTPVQQDELAVRKQK